MGIIGDANSYLVYPNFHVYSDFYVATMFIYKISGQTIITWSANCCLYFNNRWFSNVGWMVENSKCDMLYDKSCAVNKGSG